MPVNLDIIDSQFRDKLKNGDDFLSNPSDITINLVAEATDLIQVTRTLLMSWETVADPNTGVVINVTSSNTITSTEDFRLDGWAVGDTFDLIDNYSTNNLGFAAFSAEIIAISTDGLKMTLNPSGFLVKQKYTDAAIRGTTPVTSLYYKLGLIENNDVFGFTSYVSGNDQIYYGGDIGKDLGGFRDTSPVEMIPQSQFRDWVTGANPIISYIKDVNPYTQEFLLIQELRMPYYIDGELTNLLNNTLPIIYNGQSCFKLASEFEFRSVLSNPNSKKIVVDEDLLGDTGYFNESFNGRDNDYKKVSTTYEETAALGTFFDGIIIDKETTITIEVENIKQPFITGNRFGVKLFYLAPSATTALIQK